MPTINRHLRAGKERLRNFTAGNFWLRYATLAPYRALCAGLSGLTGLTHSGSHADETVEQALQYLERVFSSYKAAAGLAAFHGVVAEVGPGDSSGIGLLFLADGCTRVDLVDRFYSLRDQDHQRAINLVLVQRYPQLRERQQDRSASEPSFCGLQRHYGPRASAEEFFRTHSDYDFIVSCAVLEHAADPIAAVKAMAKALKPGGIMLHQVDCRDHGQFSTRFHELKFLELRPMLYAPLGWSGGPNRVRLSAYREAVREAGLDCTIHPTTFAGVEGEWHGAAAIPETIRDRSRAFVASVRPRLARPYRDLSEEDLVATSFMLVARRPA